MVGSIAQLISLVAYGNIYLAGAKDLKAYYPGNSTFKSCKTVSFVDLVSQDGKQVETRYADNPTEWFARLKGEGCKGLRVRRIKPELTGTADHKLAGAAGRGDRWLIEVMGAGGSDFWESRWVAANRKASDKNTWRVTYGRIASQTETQAYQAPDPDALRKALGSNLAAIRDFASRQPKPLGDFIKCFQTALAQLDTDAPLKGVGYPDITPEGVLTKAEDQLLRTAQAAWVFGGKGSWNDLAFGGKDQQLYEALTAELYMAVVACLVYAANSSTFSRTETTKKPSWRFWKKP